MFLRTLRAMNTKPFTPEEARKIVECLEKPAVFLNMTTGWPAVAWTVEHLSAALKDKTIKFRIGKRCTEKAPQFETHCSYIEATLGEFLCWTAGLTGSCIGSFTDYPLSEYWVYADYKYIALLFQDKDTMFQDVVWSDFGYPGRNGRESTLWIGTEGANTPCHLDCYGCNLVFQVQGRKRWHLFPPEDTDCLYPTRIPYEESSVFSQVNVLQPDLTKFPAFSKARAHVVTLQPGQVLFVPRHWWHYVESVDPVTVSVNSWIELEVDHKARVGEALTKTIVCALKTTPSHDNNDDWLNPTEESVASHDENMQYLNLAMQAYIGRGAHTGERSATENRASTRPPKRDSSGCLKKQSIDKIPVFTVPFGPHLIPVTYDRSLPRNLSGTSHKERLKSQDSDRGLPQQSPKARPDDDWERDQALTEERRLVAHRREETSRSSGDPGKADNEKCGTISTNDVLECLVHPDVIALVVKMMMDRQNEIDCG